VPRWRQGLSGGRTTYSERLRRLALDHAGVTNLNTHVPLAGSLPTHATPNPSPFTKMLRLLSSSTGQVTVGRGVPACERKEVGGAESGEGGGLTDAGVVARVAGLPHQAVGRLQDQVTDEELPSFVKSPAAHVVIFSGSWSEVVVVSCTVVTAPSNERSPVTSRVADETVWVTRPRAFFKFVVRRRNNTPAAQRAQTITVDESTSMTTI
jgi:hypothetical protein